MMGVKRAAWLGLSVVVLAGCSSAPGRPEERQGVVRSGSGSAQPSGRAKDLARVYGSLSKQDELRAQAVRLLEGATLSPDPQIRAHAYEALLPVPRELNRVVSRGLVDENLGVRSIAAVTVGQAGLGGHDDSLRRLLADESPFVRVSAVFALVRLGRDVDRGALAGALFQEENPGLRAHAAYLLGEIGDRSALPLLKDAARAPMPKADPARVRILDLQLSEAMTKLGDESQLEPLRAALYPAQPSDLEATGLAIQALGEVGDRSVRGTLIQLSESAGPSGELMPPEILLSVAMAMAKLGDRNGWFLGEMFWENERALVRADAAAVFGWTARTEDLAKLERMLSDPEEVVRVAAAAGLLRRL